MDWIIQHIDDVLAIGAAAIALASLIVKLTPSQTDDEWLARVRKLFEVVALNAPRTRPPGFYANPDPPPVDPAGDLANSKRPPGSMALLLAAVLAGTALQACAPPPLTSLTQPEAVQLAQICRQAGATLQDAADLRAGGGLTAEQIAAVDRLAGAARRPCSAQDAAVPRDVDRVAEALDAATGALQ